MKKVLAGLCMVVIGTGVVFAADTMPQKYTCYRTDKPITMDAKLDEPIWKKLPAMKNWTVTVNASKLYTQPTYPTIAWMCWDDTNLYVGFECTDADIFGKKTKKDDSVWEDDAFEIYIDPDGDGKNYAEFEVNPLNNILDLLIPAPWKVPWKDAAVADYEGLVTVVRSYGTLNYKYDEDEKWTGEVTIPFTSLSITTCETDPVKLNLPPKDGDTWRIQLYRSEHGKKFRASAEWTAWSPTRGTHVPEEFGYVTFSKKKP